MTVAVLIPSRPGNDEHRQRAAFHVYQHYLRKHPTYRQVIGMAPDWSKGAAIDAAFRKTDATKLVIADADCVIDPGRLQTAVDLLDSHPWVMPQTRVYRLSLESTSAVYAGARFNVNLDLERRVVRARPGGGIIVVRRDAYEKAGGIDPRFGEWQYEDLSFGYALETLVGRHVQLSGPLWHLWHPRRSRRCPPEITQLHYRYQRARNNPPVMRVLIAERG